MTPRSALVQRFAYLGTEGNPVRNVLRLSGAWHVFLADGTRIEVKVEQ